MCLLITSYCGFIHFCSDHIWGSAITGNTWVMEEFYIGIVWITSFTNTTKCDFNNSLGMLNKHITGRSVCRFSSSILICSGVQVFIYFFWNVGRSIKMNLMKTVKKCPAIFHIPDMQLMKTYDNLHFFDISHQNQIFFFWLDLNDNKNLSEVPL